MSTRGTYLIENNLCYNHYDNYPVGAALHVLNSIKKTSGISFFDFVRGMDRIEPATSKFDGPAEFHYVIQGGTIECYDIVYNEDKDEEKLVYNSGGDLDAWVNDQITKNWDRIKEDNDNINDYLLVKVNNSFSTKFDIYGQAINSFNDAVNLLEKGHTGNSSSGFGTAFKYFNLSGLDFDFYRCKYLKEYSKKFAKSYKHDDAKYFDNIVNNK